MPELLFDHYYPYAELTESIFALAAAHPDLLKVESIGKSYEGRDIWCVTATCFAAGPPAERPAFWVDGNIHATELSASAACLFFLKTLVEGYGSDEKITRCLDTRVFYVVPRLNPDGAELYFSDRPKFLRSSTRPYPYDEEVLEGLQPEDLDGDGRLLQMRIPDPEGVWKIHPDEPRLMVRRQPDEEGGQYYRVFTEGQILNYDGVTIKGRPYKERLDLNRNFPSQWRQEFEQQGAGPFPTSEPEVRTMVEFLTSHPNITGGVSFHTYAGAILRPYGTKADDEMPAEDLWTFQKIGARGTDITGYPNVSVFHDFRYHPKEVITGVSDDWMYDHLGVFAWTVEIWSPQAQAGIEDYKFIEWYREHPFEDDLKMLRWSDEKLDGKGYVDWYPFQHPQLGQVELGGWDVQYAFRNPPPHLLEEEIRRFPEWLVWHNLISPRLKLHSVEARPLGGDSYHVRLVVDNSGWLPTYISKKALEKQAVRPLVVEIELPEGAELKTGKPREEAGHLEGRAYASTAPYGWRTDATNHRAKVEWVIHAPKAGTARLTARHERAGTIHAEVELSSRV